MLRKTIGSYGGPYFDSKPIKNPQSQMSSDKGNRVFEDVAQMTRTATRAIVHFTPGATSPRPVTYHQSVWGNTATEEPVVTRLGVGEYTITYAVNLTDALGTIEAVQFVSAMQPTVFGVNGDHAQIRDIVNNVVRVQTRAETGALSDLTGSDTVVVHLI